LLIQAGFFRNFQSLLFWQAPDFCQLKPKELAPLQARNRKGLDQSYLGLR